jgi:transposase-like protein
MAKNKVQFQKGLSDAEFMNKYGTEEKCQAQVMAMKWPTGFQCPVCSGRASCFIKERKVYQCNDCHKQTSLLIGTIFQGTKLPLRKWFIAMHHLTASKQGISAMELSRRMGVSVNSALVMKHKIQQVMLEKNGKKKLSGRVEMDDAYIGGEHTGGKRGRGSENKTAFIAAVSTTEDGKPDQIKLNVVKGFKLRSIEKWARAHLDSKSQVVSDGLPCFAAVKKIGCEHDPVVVGKGRKSTQLSCFNWVNTILGNFKTSLSGTYHAISKKHIPRYLAEFQYRHNRRYDLSAMVPRLLNACVHTPPMPMRILKLAEAHW